MSDREYIIEQIEDTKTHVKNGTLSSNVGLATIVKLLSLLPKEKGEE